MWYNPRVRALIYQVLMAAIIVGAAAYFVNNLLENLRLQGISSGFDFLGSGAGFSIIMHLIPYDEASTYGRAFMVGLLNTLAVSAIGVVFATIIGFAAGVARLSPNFLLAKVSAVFVELMRNIPLLLLLFFFYFGALRNLPEPDSSISPFSGIFLNNRGLYLPFWNFASDGSMVWTTPIFEVFDFKGGVVVIPEFIALVVSLSLYTAGFIAEIVRAGILAIGKGQKEAAYSLGLSSGQALRLVIIPQAMRVIVPPMSSQYLNLIKNSSLAAAIGFPDLVQVFAGTVLSQTGQAVEVILVTMAVYLTICLGVSFFMNLYNRHVLARMGAA